MHAGQIDLHSRAVADLAVDFDVAARLLHETADLRQSESGAMTDVLGRVERLERVHITSRVMPEPLSVM
jgi:hypothetical protein